MNTTRRPGGRNWSLRGGDRYTELGGLTQQCEFDQDLYINPGPWRIPYHHHGMMHYVKRLGITLEPFFQLNYNANLHSSQAFGGKPQRFREVKADYQGHVAELLAKATRQNSLDASVTKEDQEMLLESLREWGALDKNYAYVASEAVSDRRGYEKNPGGGLSARPIPSKPVALRDVLESGLWQGIPNGDAFDMQTALFQPAGGMGRIGEAFGRELGPLIRYNSKVIDIHQDAAGVTVTFTDVNQGSKQSAHADWCLCTIPLPVLAQIPMNVSQTMASAISAVPYAAAIKVGLQFKRRFWEEDEQIFGGITYTDLPIMNIGYPNTGFQSSGKGVLLGAYIWGFNAMQFTVMTPQERVQKVVEYGSQIHPQYHKEFDNGVAVAWHRSPFAMGCFGMWTSRYSRPAPTRTCAKSTAASRWRASTPPRTSAGWQEVGRHLRARRHRTAAPARAVAQGASSMKNIITLLLVAVAVGAYADSPLFTPRAALGSLTGEQMKATTYARAAICPADEAPWAPAPIRNWPRTRSSSLGNSWPRPCSTAAAACRPSECRRTRMARRGHHT